MPNEIPLSWFTPLPPARNGIADYSFRLLEAMRTHGQHIAYCDDPLADAPSGVEVRDSEQAYRYVTLDSPILHQVGNNEGHIFVLNALRKFSGVTSLHDLSLLYLYEISGTPPEAIFADMEKSLGRTGEIFARHWKENGIKTRANYAMFDMTGEVLRTSRAVIVHSRFARNKLSSIYGEDAVRHVSVIPHFALEPPSINTTEARRRLGLDKRQFVIITAGFATAAKRFDWVIEALAALLARGAQFQWVHAGEERPSEYSLSKMLERHPQLRAVTTITGYISEADLDAYVSASDLLINLRFPSVGESSGTLSRALSMGKCCIVSDTAAYAELPRNAVIQIPVAAAVPALIQAISILQKDRDLLEGIGACARFFSKTVLSPASVARSYWDTIESAYENGARFSSTIKYDEPMVTQTRVLDIKASDFVLGDAAKLVLRSVKGEFLLNVWFGSAEELADASLIFRPFIARFLAPHVLMRKVSIVNAGTGKHPHGKVALRIEGRTH